MKKTMFKRSMIILFLLCLAGFLSLAGAVDLPNINKSKIRFSIAPGKAEYGEIIVENQSAEPRSMRVYLSDWDYLPPADGTKEFLPISSTPLSCAAWISFSPAEFILPPFSKQKIDYSVKAPAGASGGYYAALFFESIFAKAQAPKEGMQVGMNLVIRIATLFYVDVEGTVKRTASIDNLLFKKDVGKVQYSIGLDFRNTGNVDISAGGTFHIMDDKGMVIARGELNDAYTFPAAGAKLAATLKEGLPKGKYDLVFTLDLGKALEEANIGRGPIITKEAEISIGENGKILNIGQLK
ncbi:MAG: hypothetical protein Q7K98_04480 [Candidatus Omnitrophota bacterium]|nr:hypothetical protein [Candidatus Omnitrophota bacterium]